MRVVVTTDGAGSVPVRVADRDRPSPAAGEALVEVQAASLNYRDLLVVDGIGRWRPPPGRIPGSDACGTVVAVGPGVREVAVGQRVVSTILPNWVSGALTAGKLAGSLGGSAADGVMAQFALLPAQSLVPVGDWLTPVELSTFPCAALTAWHALQRAGSLAAGKTILLQGTGGVSIFALQMAVAAGARAVITSSSDEKIAKALDLGAFAGINYRSSADWVKEASSLVPEGYDHILDMGGAATLAQSIELAAFEGTVSIIGLIGGLEASIDITPVFAKNLRIDGIEVGSRAMLVDLLKWYQAHRLRPVVDRVFGLDEVAEALAYLRSGTHFGKVVLSLA